ncbi:MAG: lectin-like protein [Verrucomicrobiales bacterium]
MIALLAAGSALYPQSTNASVIAGPVVNPDNGHRYYLLSQASWTLSRDEALALGGNLATINDVPEQNWIFSTFGSFAGENRSLWIGLNDEAQEGTFVWASGEPVVFTNWLPGQPDDNAQSGGEDYAHIIKTGNGFGVTPGAWNDLADTAGTFPEFAPTHGIAEVIPEPSALLILFASAAAFGLRRRRVRS